MKTRVSSFVAGTLLGCFLFTMAVFAQTESKKPAQDPSSKPIKAKSEINDAHKRWVHEDVAPIITAAEREAFRRLTTNEERENFIATLWRLRDPDPDTEENEYREEYYERIAYANQHFTSGVPGWKTDRGRTYIRWGKPDSIESRPAGGAYDRPSYEGGGSTTVYPFETWFYRHLEGVGDGVEIEFVDPTGTGEYRIARSPDEKDALAWIPGAGMKAFETSKADRLINFNHGYQREQDSFFRRQEIIANLQKAPSPKFSELDRIASGEVTVFDKNPLEIDHRIDFFRLSDEKVIVAFTVQTDNRTLTFDRVGNTARLNIFGRITAVAGKRVGVFEDAVTATATQQELAERTERRSIYQKAVVLAPGTYKVDLAVRDVVTGNQGVVRQGFTVPRYDDQKLSTSTLILASKLRPTGNSESGAMFNIGGNKIVPNLSGTYRAGQDIGVYLQIYNAGLDQTTLRPAVDVEYVLVSGGKQVRKLAEDWSGLSDAGRRLTLAKMISTSGLPVGEYELKVLIRDKVGGQVIENKGKFTVTQ